MPDVGRLNCVLCNSGQRCEKHNTLSGMTPEEASEFERELDEEFPEAKKRYDEAMERYRGELAGALEDQNASTDDDLPGMWSFSDFTGGPDEEWEKGRKNK